MDAAEYAALTAACDALLRDPSRTLARVAIPWLHVLSDHPNTIGRYRGACAGERPGPGRRLMEGMRVGRSLARSLRPLPLDAPREGERVDLLVVSHLVSAEHADTDSDFYFGTLQQALAERGVTSLTVLRNHAAGDERKLARRVRREGAAARVLLPRAASASVESRGLMAARRVGGALVRASRRADDGCAANVARVAATHAATEGTLATLRLHAQVSELCARLRPRAVLVTYEGHAWERIVFHAARAVDPAVRCIGYQHTILFPGSHAVARALGVPYDPDVLLTVGDVTRDALAARGGLPATRLLTYGSHRRAPAQGARAADDTTRCVVIPEGLESECVALFDFAMECAARLPDVQFVLRMHPVLPFERLAVRHPRFAALPANMVLSDNVAIADDFARCRWALYRGSSAAVHAVLAGVRPLYVRREGEQLIDPLWALEGWREEVGAVGQVAGGIERDTAASPEAWREASRAARAFCGRYVMPPDPDVVAGLLRVEHTGVIGYRCPNVYPP